MKILIVSATEAEVHALSNHFQDNASVRFLITGVGMVATAYALGSHLAENYDYDLVINAGIAGSFDRKFDLGTVLFIEKDTLAELGAENDEQFIPIDELGFGASTFYADQNLELFSGLPTVAAITVNRVHGNAQSIQQITQRLDVQVESMEGAAVFYACQKSNLPVVQIRALSNYVEKRNRENWDIPLAVNNLNKYLINTISKIL